MASHVEELQAEALNSSVPVDDLLRKAKIVAEKLDIRDFADWIERELTGYGEQDEYPVYRKVQGEKPLTRIVAIGSRLSSTTLSGQNGRSSRDS